MERGSASEGTKKKLNRSGPTIRTAAGAVEEGRKQKQPPSSDKGGAKLLRRMAEEKLKQWLAAKDVPSEPFQYAELLHELHTHQIELEMQNEELRLAQESLAESQSKYLDLYHFAPVGYLTLDSSGLIVEANLTASQLLGMERSGLVKMPLRLFLCQESDRRALHMNIDTALKTGGRCTCEMMIKRKKSPPFYAQLQTMPAEDSRSGKTSLRVTVSDITDSKMLEELHESRKRLRELTAHIETLREEERQIVSREVHDELGQLLTGLSMDIFVLGKKCQDDEALREGVKGIAETISLAIEEVQRVSTRIRPRMLDHLGLEAAIKSELRDFAKRSGLLCEADIPDQSTLLPADLSSALFRIFQEALTNVARHARAKKVRLSLRRGSDWVDLEVADDGIGIPAERLSAPDSFGLMGVRERVAHFGGTVMITGAKNKGTIVKVVIPLGRNERQ